MNERSRKRIWMLGLGAALLTSLLSGGALAATASADSSVGVFDEYVPPGANPGGHGGPGPAGGGPTGSTFPTGAGGSYPGSSAAERKAVGPSARGARAGSLPFTGYPLNPLILVLLALLLLALVVRLYSAARERADWRARDADTPGEFA